MGNLTSNETNVQHVVIFTDMVSGGVRVVDLDILPSDKEITLTKEDTIWSFERSEDNGWDMSIVTRRGIDDAHQEIGQVLRSIHLGNVCGRQELVYLLIRLRCYRMEML